MKLTRDREKIVDLLGEALEAYEEYHDRVSTVTAEKLKTAIRSLAWVLGMEFVFKDGKAFRVNSWGETGKEV